MTTLYLYDNLKVTIYTKTLAFNRCRITDQLAWYRCIIYDGFHDQGVLHYPVPKYRLSIKL